MWAFTSSVQAYETRGGIGNYNVLVLTKFAWYSQVDASEIESRNHIDKHDLVYW